MPYKEEVLVKLFTEIAPRYTQRPGGYTRIIPSVNASVILLKWPVLNGCKLGIN